MDTITLPTAADMHIHLRQGSLMTMVTPAVAEGGVSICYVMVTLLSFFLPCLFFPVLPFYLSIAHLLRVVSVDEYLNPSPNHRSHFSLMYVCNDK